MRLRRRRNFDRGVQRCQWGAELVRCLACELPLPLERHLEAVDKPIEAVCEVVQLVSSARTGETAIVEWHLACRLCHEGQRRQGASSEIAADRSGKHP